MNCHFTRLEQEALLHISGPDTLTFLQGQTTCDTRIVDREHAIPGAYCTPQGRVVCDFLLVELGDEHCALRMRRDILATASKTFGKYIVFSKATLEDERRDWQVIGVYGLDARRALQQVFGAAPEGAYGALRGDGFVIVQTDEAGQHFECFIQESQSVRILDEMNDVMQAGDEAEWQKAQVGRCVARIEAATVEEHVPQTLNYDLTGHISFDKGCYTGQEVVARLHYRGTPKRRTYLALLPEGTATTAGTRLLDDGTGKTAGSVVNAVGNTLLIETTTDGAASGLRLDDESRTPLTPGPMPYPLKAG